MQEAANIVLDTIIIVKSLLKPAKHLPRNIYDRELSTHKKCGEDYWGSLEEVWDLEINEYIDGIIEEIHGLMGKRLI